MRRLSPGSARFLMLSAIAVGLGVWQGWAPQAFPVGDLASIAARPAQSVLTICRRAVAEGWSCVVQARRDAAEIRQLRRELTRLRQENVALAEQRLENQRLRRQLGLRTAIGISTVATEVVGRQAVPKMRLLIGRGRRDGIERGDAVLAPAGVLGQVERVSASSAWVVPLTAESGRAGVLIERTRQTGIVVGDRRGCRIEEMDLDADVHKGDLVITSGAGGVYPKGVAVGHVERVERDPALSRTWARVRPAVNWRQVEEVLVVVD